jgi:proteic killer suppression protein
MLTAPSWLRRKGLHPNRSLWSRLCKLLQTQAFLLPMLDAVRRYRTYWNHVRFRHKGLRQLHEDGNAKGVPAAMADKLRKLLFALETAETLEQLGRFPGWKLHPLKSDLKGFWSLTVTGNWRLIFRYDEKTNTAGDIDLIDYH